MTAQKLSDDIKLHADQEVNCIVRKAEGRSNLLLEKTRSRLQDIQRDIDGITLKRWDVETSIEATIQALRNTLDYVREQEAHERDERVLLHRLRHVEWSAEGRDAQDSRRVQNRPEALLACEFAFGTSRFVTPRRVRSSSLRPLSRQKVCHRRVEGLLHNTSVPTCADLVSHPSEPRKRWRRSRPAHTEAARIVTIARSFDLRYTGALRHHRVNVPGERPRIGNARHHRQQPLIRTVSQSVGAVAANSDIVGGHRHTESVRYLEHATSMLRLALFAAVLRRVLNPVAVFVMRRVRGQGVPSGIVR